MTQAIKTTVKTPGRIYLEEKAKTKDCFTAQDLSKVLNNDPNTIRMMARNGVLGFPSIVSGCSVRFPAIPFFRFMGWLDEGGESHG